MNIEAWTDGSVQPQNPGNISSGCAILISRTDPQFIAVRATFNSGVYQTNNMGEIQGILNAIEMIKPGPFKNLMHLHSDSKYALGGLNKIMGGGRGYKKNSELWVALDAALQERPNLKIITNHVHGHVGIRWNEIADSFAYASAVLTEEIHLTRTTVSTAGNKQQRFTTFLDEAHTLP